MTDDEDSTFVGIITKDGLLDGHLQTRQEEFYIEPAERYFDLNFDQHDFHSVIYVTGDVNFPSNAMHGAISMANNNNNFFTNNDSTTLFVRYIPLFNPFQTTTNIMADHWFDQTKTKRPRRSTNISKNQMMNNNNGNNKSSSNENETSEINIEMTTTSSYNVANKLINNDDHNKQRQIMKENKQQQSSNNHGIYWRDMDSLHYTESEPYGIKAVHPRTHWIDDQRHHDRHVVVDPKKTTCMLYLQADHLFYEKMGSEEACIESMTRHVQKVNNIYKNTGHLNTGIVTLLNYGKHVPPIVSHVTLAHEIGHNFGSPHDPEDDHACTPGGENGNYIMFARATSGDKRNNNKFSPCSLRSINAVLNTKAKSLKGCFQG
ncbi:hypothetical protein BLA29_003334 [Euroglyphus maynei]|uniref:Peptidase M12B domain-containing protein n=1 Tax=Euroglyphus maynei TaxID=6958 RepID=A0A1Y3BTI6_EURMA|nr:hypothetical protein BLA29_003334 [Euroglyphus maynei]